MRDLILNDEISAFMFHEQELTWLHRFYVEKVDIIKSELIVYASLGYCSNLLSFKSGCILEFLRVLTGDPSEHKNGEIVMKVRNCRLTESWIEDLIPYDPNEKEVVLYAKILGDIEVLWAQP